jgi:hypothetical protein
MTNIERLYEEDKLEYAINMKAPNTIEKEINQIRLQIHEKTKYMTPTQLTEYYKQSTDDTIKKYGFRVINSANELANN